MNPASQASLQQQAAYLQSLPAIRERCALVFNLAKDGKLEYWEYHAEKENEVIDYCANVIQVSKIYIYSSCLYCPRLCFIDNLTHTSETSEQIMHRQGSFASDAI
jgi:hypothetical protein